MGLPYAGASPLDARTFRPNVRTEVVLLDDGLLFRDAKGDGETVAWRDLNEIKVVSPFGAPLYWARAAMTAALFLMTAAAGLVGLLVPGVPKELVQWLPLAAVLLVILVAFYRDPFMVVQWPGRRRIERLPKSKETEARRFVDAVRRKRSAATVDLRPPAL